MGKSQSFSHIPSVQAESESSMTSLVVISKKILDPVRVHTLHLVVIVSLDVYLFESSFPDLDLVRREQVTYLVTLPSSLCLSCLGGQTYLPASFCISRSVELCPCTGS